MLSKALRGNFFTVLVPRQRETERERGRERERRNKNSAGLPRAGSGHPPVMANRSTLSVLSK